MKYAYASVLFVAGAYATATSTSDAASGTITAAPTMTSLGEQAQCVHDNCPDHSNVSCMASCYNVPFQGSANVDNNVQCVRTACMGYQSSVEITAYASCVSSCQLQYYYNPSNSGGVPNVVATGSGSKETGSSGSNGSGSGSSGSNGSKGSGSGSGTATGSGASASATGKSAANRFTYSAAGLLGAVGLVALIL